MRIRLIAIDIDGTLMPSRGPQISQRNLAALRAAEDAGIEIVIATGRRHGFAMPLISPLGLRRDSIMISSNGAVVRSLEGSLLEQRFLPAKFARQLCGQLRPHGTLVFTFDRGGPGALVMEDTASVHPSIERWVEANRPYLLEVRPIERAFDQGEFPIQGMVCGGVASMRRAEEELRERGFDAEISMHRTEYPARDLGMLDLLPLNCSKGTALHWLAQRRGFEREEIMAIGDNLNDVEMLEYAGRPLVMANAGEELLALASTRGWDLTAANDDDGVAVAVEAVLREHKSFPLNEKGSRNGSSASAPDEPCEHPKGRREPSTSDDTITGWAR